MTSTRNRTVSAFSEPADAPPRRSRRFTPEQALAIVPPICEALYYAHEHGIVRVEVKRSRTVIQGRGAPVDGRVAVAPSCRGGAAAKRRRPDCR